MPRRRLRAFAFLLLPSLLAAQSGAITYDRAVRSEFEAPPGMQNSEFARQLSKPRVTSMLLRFSEAATLLTELPAEVGGGSGEVRFVRGGQAIAVMTRRDAGSAAPAMRMVTMMGGSDRSTVVGLYANLATDSLVEQREFLGKRFLIPDQRPRFAWKLTGAQGTFLGHPVMQATAQQDSTSVEAWFTPDIPISAGPEAYGGLPGMILTLTVDSGRVTYTATKVDLATAVTDLKPPTDGAKVTRTEFDRIVTEKLAEIRKLRGTSGRDF